jgi:sulfofructosephosphate aldolase
MTPTSALARPNGAFAMMAIDGRESTRKILRDAGKAHGDGDLSAIKVDIARELGAGASAILCDPVYGTESMRIVRDELPGTGLIVAVDRFTEPRFGPLQESELDEAAMDAAAAFGGVDALKLYLYWRPGADHASVLAQAQRFVERSRELGVLSLLEGVVPLGADAPDFDAHLVEAAAAFGALRPDVYKTQAPTLGQGALDEIEAVSRRLTDAAGVPWVVLSNGVSDSRFPEVVAAVCRGGASGFLAGRGVWRAAAESDDRADFVARGRARLAELVEVEDREVRA